MSWLFDLFSRSYRTLAGWQWIVLFAIPPLIVLLYFLKLKRQPLEVPSTYLWHRTIEDLHVNSLWQRLRQNLLMFLQLLILLLAILACLRPSWEGTSLSEDRYVFLVDTSASMSASDVSPSRLEDAQEKLLDAIDQLKSGSAAMIISFSDRAIVEQPFTTNRRLLQRRARAIMPTQRGSELEEALRVAAGLANPGRTASDATDVAAADAMPATLMIYSDGRYRSAPQVAMGNLQPIYIPIGTETPENVGVLAFNSGVNPDRPDQLHLFGRVKNFGTSEQTVTANLYLHNPNRNLLDATQVTLPADAVGGVEFTIDAIDAGELRLEIEEQDALMLDNTAYIAINPRKKANVMLATPRNDALEIALATPFISKLADVQTVGPEYLETEDYKKQIEAGLLDLIIFDQCAPASMPRANTFFIGSLPPDQRWTTEGSEELPQIIDTDQAHPLMRFVQMGDVMWIVNSAPLQPPQGARVLVDSHKGPIIAIAPRGGFEDLVQAFPIVSTDEQGERYANTDWTIRISFPVFLGNVMTYLTGLSIEADQDFTRPGTPITLKATKPVPEITVRSPSGQTQRIGRDATNAFVYGLTESTGVYEVRESGGDNVKQRVAVNLFDDVESDIAISSAVKTDYEDIQGTAVTENKRREFWKYLLALGLLVLMIEWYIYNQRVYV